MSDVYPSVARNENCHFGHAVTGKAASAIDSHEGSLESAGPIQEDQHNVYVKSGTSDGNSVSADCCYVQPSIPITR